VLFELLLRLLHGSLLLKPCTEVAAVLRFAMLQ
jgi:hypothetical protein